MDYKTKMYLEDVKKAVKVSTIVFRNKAMHDLWNEELCGQISDGMWENTRNSGWEFWTDIETDVDEKLNRNLFIRDENVVQNIYPAIKRSFGFNRLTKYVGDRMLNIVQKTEPNATMQDVKKYLNEIQHTISCK